MINSLIITGIIVTTIVLNIITTKQVVESIMHSLAEKKKMVLIIWLLPVFGPLRAVSQLREGAVRHREKMDQAMVDELNKLTEKIDGIRNQVEQQKRKKMH